MATCQISLADSQISKFYSQRNSESATSLASLINRQPSSDKLGSVLDDTINHLFLSSFAQRPHIDVLVSFLSSVARQIEAAISHPGYTVDKPYKTTVLRPSNGPGIIPEHLSHALYRAIWGHTSRAYTPDEESDKELPKGYYRDASVYATILARAFATQPLFRSSLWREVGDAFVKGLFSGPEQEPGVFVVLTTLILGAGAEIREYILQEERAGKGMAWLWYNDIRTAADEEWGWQDIVEALSKEPLTGMASRLPGYVKASLERAQRHVSDGGSPLKSWDSEMLAKDAFAWVDES